MGFDPEMGVRDGLTTYHYQIILYSNAIDGMTFSGLQVLTQQEYLVELLKKIMELRLLEDVT